jgi:hypothetical protein
MNHDYTSTHYNKTWEFFVRDGLLTIIPHKLDKEYFVNKIYSHIQKVARREMFDKPNIYFLELFRLSRMAYELVCFGRISNITRDDLYSLCNIDTVGIEQMGNIKFKFYFVLGNDPKHYPILADQSAKSIQNIIEG